MAEISDYDFEGYGKLPKHVIRAAAAEYITRFLMPQIEGFMAMAIEAMSKDCDIEANEAESAIIERLQTMTSRLKPGQYTVNHAAIMYKLWDLFSAHEDETLLAANDFLATGILSPAAKDKPAPSAQQDKPQYWQRPDDSDNETSSN